MGSSDKAVLVEMGARFSRLRIQKELTQAELAEQAGVSKRTIERLESGEVAVNLTAFIRVCRVLGLFEQMNGWLPDLDVTPMEKLRLQGEKRQRVRSTDKKHESTTEWKWGESS